MKKFQYFGTMRTSASGKAVGFAYLETMPHNGIAPRYRKRWVWLPKSQIDITYDDGVGERMDYIARIADMLEEMDADTRDKLVAALKPKPFHVVSVPEWLWREKELDYTEWASE